MCPTICPPRFARRWKLLWTSTSCLSDIVIKYAWLAEIINSTVGIYGVLHKSKQSQRRICVSCGLFLETDKIREIVQRLAKAVSYRELSVCVWLYFLRCSWRVELCRHRRWLWRVCVTVVLFRFELKTRRLLLFIDVLYFIVCVYNRMRITGAARHRAVNWRWVIKNFQIMNFLRLWFKCFKMMEIFYP